MVKSDEDKALGGMDKLLKRARGRDDQEGFYLQEVLEGAFKAYPSTYRSRWLERLRAQPEGYWSRALRTCTSAKELARWYKLVPMARFDVDMKDARDVDVLGLSRVDGISRVAKLSLRGSTLSTKSVQYLLSKKCDLGEVRYLSLHGDPEQLGNGCARLFAATKKFGALERLTLTYNGIGEAGALAFAQATHYEKLTWLSLIRPELYTEVGLRAIAESSTLPELVCKGHQVWVQKRFEDGDA